MNGESFDQAPIDLSTSARLMDAHDEERRRIAVELREEICQCLTALAIELHQLPTGSQDGIQAWSEELFNRTVHISEAVQSLSHQLHCATLDYLGITTATRGFCVEFAEQQHATVDFTFGGVFTHIGPELSLCLFRVLQDALRNVVQHSGVRHVEVRLDGTATDVVLTIRDRGTGFDPALAMRGEGLGLISMRARAHHLHGALLVTSRPDWGTEIRLSLPIRLRRAKDNKDHTVRGGGPRPIPRAIEAQPEKSPDI